MTARNLAGPMGLTGDYSGGEDGWTASMNANLLRLSLLPQLTVKSRVTALPGSPTNGDLYIVPSGAGSHPNEVAARDNGGWVYITAFEGLRAWLQDEDLLVVWNGSAWVTPPRSVSFSCFSVPAPTSSQILLDQMFVESTVFADDLAGSRASVGTNPASTFLIDVRKNGSSVGSISISTGGVATFTTTGGSLSFAAGDLLSLIAPGTTDGTIARLRITLKAVQ